MGYCSKCYKELERDAQRDGDQQGQRSQTITPMQSPLSPIDEQTSPTDAGMSLGGGFY